MRTCLFRGIEGKYIGGGADAHVFAMQEANQSYALKRYIAGDDTPFKTESTMLWALSECQFVAKLLFISNDYPNKFIAMELCGQSLHDYTRDQNKLGKAVQVRLAKQISRELITAILCMHNANIIHRDIKLANIVFARDADPLTSANSIKIIDFGAAIFFDNIMPEFGGTMVYAAPEMIVEKRVTPAADVWMFANAIFELMTNQVIFDAENDYDYDYLEKIRFLHEEYGSELDDSGDAHQDGSDEAQSISGDPLSESEASCCLNTQSDNSSASDIPDDFDLFVLLYRILFLQQKLFGAFPRSITKWGPDYFNAEGRLKNTISVVPMSLFTFINTNFAKNDVKTRLTDDFQDLLSICLRLDPRDRARPSDILKHSWLKISPKKPKNNKKHNRI